MPGCIDVNWIGNGNAADYSSLDEFKKMSGSYDARYYDQLITRLNLQAIEENEYDVQQQLQEERAHQQEEKIPMAKNVVREYY